MQIEQYRSSGKTYTNVTTKYKAKYKQVRKSNKSQSREALELKITTLRATGALDIVVII